MLISDKEDHDKTKLEVTYSDSSNVHFYSTATYDVYPVKEELSYAPQVSESVTQKQRAKRQIRKIAETSWPLDLQPSRETLQRTDSFWREIQDIISRLNVNAPAISVADDNSIDLFWGNKSERVLINIPASLSEPIFLHFINEKGQTTVNFTDSHKFNVYNFIRELKNGIG